MPGVNQWSEVAGSRLQVPGFRFLTWNVFNLKPGTLNVFNLKPGTLNVFEPATWNLERF
jgi:hypothetical protein